MKFHERRYTVHAFLIGAEAAKPWLSSMWQGISDATLSSFRAASDRPAVRTVQYDGSAPQMPELKFGRIAHDAKGAAKWTHASEGILNSGQHALFQSTEVWAPSWNATVRNGKAPDVYLCISNRLAFLPKPGDARNKFDALCIFAVSDDPESQDPGQAKEAALSLSAVLSPAVGFRKTMTWGRGSGGGFTDAINDLHLDEPFRPPILQEDQPQRSLIDDGWHVFPGTTA